MRKTAILILTLILAACSATESSMIIRQLPSPEEITSIETIMEQLSLSPHTCAYPLNEKAWNQDYWTDGKEEITYTNTGTDGTPDRDYSDRHNTSCTITAWNYGEREYISSKGTDIKFTGGRLLKVTTWRSGKKDTCVLCEPEYATSTTYRFFNNDAHHGPRNIEDTTQSPSSSVNGNTWTIERIGAEWVIDISHTLTATAGDSTTSLTVRQNDNWPLADTTSSWMEIKGHWLHTQREHWPEFEDYPIGSIPKWPKAKDVPYDDPSDPSFTHSTKDTKSFHPDGNRYIRFYFSCEGYAHYGNFSYMSGAVQRDQTFSKLYLNRYRNQNWLRGGVTVTATANVKLTNGRDTTVTHISEWIQDPNDQISYLDYFYLYLPVVENAAEDFEWTIDFVFDHNKIKYMRGVDLDNGNFHQYDWSIESLTFRDCLYTEDQFTEERRLSYFSDGSMDADVWYNRRYLGDIIDGVPFDKSSLNKYKTLFSYNHFFQSSK